MVSKKSLASKRANLVKAREVLKAKRDAEKPAKLGGDNDKKVNVAIKSSKAKPVPISIASPDGTPSEPAGPLSLPGQQLVVFGSPSEPNAVFGVSTSKKNSPPLSGQEPKSIKVADVTPTELTV